VNLTLTFRATLALVCCTGFSAVADDPGPKWETVVTGPINVKNRERVGTPVKEIWAEGEIDAPVQDIQEVIIHPELFKNFMPYMKESREIGKPEADGSIYVYTKLDLPVVTARDYIVRSWNDELVTPDGKGTFRNHWTAVPKKTPERSGVVRVQIDDGSWEITAKKGDPNKSSVIYKFAIDPGGWIPKFAASMGNEKGVVETFKAVEKEAQRRMKLRQGTPATPGLPSWASGVLPGPDAGAAAAVDSGR
jgi:hypothetical protein